MNDEREGLERIEDRLDAIEDRLDNLEDQLQEDEEAMSTFATQADINAVTAALDAVAATAQQISTDTTTAQTTLQTEIDALSAANPGLNVGPLQAAAASLGPIATAIDGHVVALGALKPTVAAVVPPAPPAA